MQASISTAAERAAIVAELGHQDLGRRALARKLGWTEREARSALEHLRRPVISEPQPAEFPDAVPTEVSFRRSEATDLTNWRNWDRECNPPQRIEETDRKGNPRTVKVIHDPGIVWPPEWKGPKVHEDLLIGVDAPKPRPKKWGVLVSTQQSHTPVHGPALMSMIAYAGWGGYSIHLMGMETKPPSGGSKVDEIAPWSALTERYVSSDKIDLGGVVIDGAFPMKPTYENPLDGIGAYCGGRNHIFASMRQDMLTLGRIEGEQNIAQCSGAITVPNYSHSKAGMVAIENHVIGAVVVECDLDGDIHIRNLELDPVSGELWDVDVVVSDGVVRPRKVFETERCLKRPVVNAGCIHARLANKGCLSAIWGIDGKPKGDVALMEALDPSEQVLHDVFDAGSVSPHNRKNPVHQLRKRVSGNDNVAEELKLTADLIEKMGSKRRRTWLIDSNHDRHFDRFLLETDWKRDLLNAETFLQVNLAQLQAIRAGDRDFSALAYALRLFNPTVKFETSRFADPLRWCRYYYHCHGDRGTNGSSGAATNFVNLGFHLSIAHGHTVMRRRRLAMSGYIGDAGDHAVGPHNRAHGIGVEYANGSYQMILISKGKWRA